MYLTFLLFSVMVARKNLGGLFNPLLVFAVINHNSFYLDTQMFGWLGLPPGMLPDVTGHLVCFCWVWGFLRALDLLRMVVLSKNCFLNVKLKMFPHFGKMLPNMFPNMPDDVLLRPRRQACWGTLLCYRVQYAGTCVPRYTFCHFSSCPVCSFPHLSNSEVPCASGLPSLLLGTLFLAPCHASPRTTTPRSTPWRWWRRRS